MEEQFAQGYELLERSLTEGLPETEIRTWLDANRSLHDSIRMNAVPVAVSEIQPA